MKVFYYLFLVILIFNLISCGSEVEEVDTDAFGYDYYPVRQGSQWVYACDSIIVRLSGPRRDTLRSYIKEEIGSTYIDAQGKEIKKIFRYWKRNINDEWTPINTWTMFNDSNLVVRNEENIALLRLVFPLYKGKQWNPTVYIDPSLEVDAGGDIMKLYEGWNAEVNQTEGAFSLDGTSYSTLDITMVNTESIIDIRNVVDSYVKNIGLVKRTMIMYDCNGNNLQAPWSVKANQGFEHTLTLVSYTP